MQKNAVIIGSGIAGLASALRLRHKGYAVSVFEANDHPGGKLDEITKDAFRWDAGPSLFTLPALVDELFELYDLDSGAHFQYSRKENICNYFWQDGSRFSVSADIKKFIEEAAAYFGEAPDNISNYITRSRRKYELTRSVFLEKSLHKLSHHLDLDTLKALVQVFKLDVNKSLDTLNREYFDNPKLVQLFNRFATYNGSSPYQTPGTMSLIPHLEMGMGCFFPRGGMISISKSLYKLAVDSGVEFNFGEPVLGVLHKNGSATGIRTHRGSYGADIVVSNMDVFSSYEKLLADIPKPTRSLKQERSSSALIFYWGIQKQFRELDLHNIFFSADYESEFRMIFEERTISSDPTVYINITSKEEAGDAPQGCENWFVMINTPGDYGQDWDTLIEAARQDILNKLSGILGVDISELIVCEEVLHPRLIEARTSSHRGSLYGSASNSKFAAFLRHPNFSSEIGNLYFAGGSVHPGGGIPLCLLSAKIVSSLIPAA